MSNDSFLLISLIFPPLNRPRAHHVRKLLRGLNIDTHWITSNLSLSDQSQISKDISSHVKSVHIVPTEKHSPLLWVFIHLAPDFLGGLIGGWNIAFCWARRVSKYVLKRAKDFPVKAIVTFSDPAHAHWAGLLLKKRLNLPWVAYLSDPVCGNPYHFPEGRTLRLGRRLFERLVVTRADRVIFTTQEQIEACRQRNPSVPAEKFRLLGHAYEDEVPTVRRAKQEKYVVRYLGNFFGPRTPYPFLDAWEEILRTDPGLLHDVKVEFVAHAEDSSIHERIQKFPGDAVSLVEPVPYDVSLRLLGDTDLLLLLDAPSENDSLFFSSKLATYLSTEIPILGMTPPGATARIIRRAGGYVANPMDKQEMVNQIKVSLKNLRSGVSVVGEREKAYRREFSLPRHIEEFQNILLDACQAAVVRRAGSSPEKA